MCSAPWYSKTRRSSFRRVTAHRYSRKIVIRTSFSTITNTIELGSWSLTRLVSPTGSRKNSPTAIASANVTVPIHVRARDRLVVLGGLRVGGDVQRLDADPQRLSERDDAAHDRPAQPAMALEDRDEREALDLDLAERGLAGLELTAALELLGQRHADGDGPRRDAAHHHALEHGLPADGQVAAGYEGVGRRQPLCVLGGCQR